MGGIHAMRMKRLGDAVEAEKKYGLSTLYIHLSALSPTTRKSHANRHGLLFTAQEMKELWGDPENAEGCKCTFAAVLIGDDRLPLVPAIQERAMLTYKKMKKRGYDWSK